MDAKVGLILTTFLQSHFIASCLALVLRGDLDCRCENLPGSLEVVACSGPATEFVWPMGHFKVMGVGDVL